MRVQKVISSEAAAFHALRPANLFSSEAWCNCYDERLQRFYLLDSNDKAVGGFVAFEGGKGGLTTLITAPFAPHVGLFAEENKNNPVKVNSFRKEIIEAMASVDRVVVSGHASNPADMSVCGELRRLKPHIFANGGDRTRKNIPEVGICNEIGCKIIFNVGRGGKIRSSSELVANFAKES